MKKTILVSLILLIVGAVALMAKKTEPVVMKVGNQEVTLSEFEYLYNKNRQQQQQPQTLDEYVDMFVNYKLKVADALAEKIDTTAAYRNDLRKYISELSQPYMRDTTVVDSLVKVAHDHMLENVNVSHIMIPLYTPTSSYEHQIAYLDSVRSLIVNGEISFADAARQYSEDRSTKAQGGSMNYASAGMFPYEFEDVAWNTKVGEVSPVFQTRFGHHILTINDRRKAPGEVKTRHILRLTQGLNAEKAAVKKQEIDSLYQLAISGANFAELATANTEDPSGKKNGGELPWFGPGRMVPEFEAAAFQLAPGEVSKPIRTAYGYHIILCEDRRDVPSLDESRKQIMNMMERDSRAFMAEKRQLDKYRKYIPVVENKKGAEAVENILAAAGGLNATSIEQLAACKQPLVTIGKASFTVADVAGNIEPATFDLNKAKNWWRERQQAFVDVKFRDAVIEYLPEVNSDFRNLMNEYRDGILLYEISNKKVWDKANQDKAGLEQYFNDHRAEFVWDKPHYKGFVILSESDSIANSALEYLKANPMPQDSLVTSLRRQFANKVKIEKVLAGKGDNAIVDYVAFGGQRPEPVGRWSAYVGFEGEIIDQPREAADVRGPVSLGYQNQLEEEWLKYLKRKYPVKIYRKELKKLEDAAK